MALRTSEISRGALLDRRRTGADVAAVLSFRGRGRQQQLFRRDPAHQRFMPIAAGAVPDQAGHLGLMHGEDHGSGGAGAAERVADLGDVVDRGTEAAELDRNLHAEKFLRAGGVDRGLRKARFEVDLFGLRGGCGCDRRGALMEQRAPVEQQTFGCVTGGRVTKRGFANVHGCDLRNFSVLKILARRQCRVDR